jgi:hypothetical protein
MFRQFRRGNYIVVLLYIAFLFISFSLGLFLGVRYRETILPERYHFYVNLDVVKAIKDQHRKIKDNLCKQEKLVVKIFKNNFDKCVSESLSHKELEIVENAKKELLDLEELLSDRKIDLRYRIRALYSFYKSLSSNKQTLKSLNKIRACNSIARKHMTKMDRRIFSSVTSKMKLEDIINLHYGL